MTAVAAALFAPLALIREEPASSEDFANSDSVEALYFTIPGGRASPTGFATLVTSALVVPLVLDQEDPFSPGGSASSDSVMALCCAISGGRP